MDEETWQKEIMRADLIWALLLRAGVRIEQHGEFWQWAIDPPAKDKANPQEIVWHGAFHNPSDALQDALYALTTHYQEPNQ